MAQNQVYDGHALRFFPVRVGTDVLPDTPLRRGGMNIYTMTDSFGGAAPNGLHSSNAPGFATCAFKGAFHVAVDTTGNGVATGGAGTPVYIAGDGVLTLEPDDGGTPAEEYPVWGYVLSDTIVAGEDTRLLVAIATTI